MKYWRIVIGLALFALVVWIIVGEQMAGASADAVVNAEVVTVRAPVAGQISMPSQPIGSSVSREENLATLSDSRADDLRYNDLAMEVSLAEAKVKETEKLASSLRNYKVLLEDRLDTYTRHRIAELEIHLKHARTRLQLLMESRREGDLESNLDRGQSGNPGDPLLPGVALEYARERVAVLEIELEAAKEGVFLGDGYNDAPVSGQLLVETNLRIEETKAALTEANARLTAVRTRLADERIRLSQLRAVSLLSPVNGLVWEHLAFDGEFVQRGQDILRLVNCDSAFVTLSVTEPTFNSLFLGDIARFRLSGTDLVFDGIVIRLAGSGAEDVYTNLAIAPSERHLERFDVALMVPELRDFPDKRCPIGNTGRAFFSSRPLDGLRALFE